jgi:NADPH:quinone reductase
MKCVSAIGAGGPEVLRITEEPAPQPGPGEVLIEVHAAGVNRPDLSQRAGSYPPPPDASPRLGLEVAGVVAAAPHGSRWNVGDAVCALVHGGGYAEFCVAAEGHALPLPRGWRMEEAAGIPETFFTVWANLFDIGRLREGERVLAHGGASGIGTTAIQLARAFGAEVIVTAGTDDKCERCKALGAHHAINYRTAAFDEEVRRITGGEGVDVILDIVGASYTERNLDCLARDGRLLQVGLQQGATAKVSLAKIMQKRLWVTGSTMRPRTVAEKAAIAQSLRERVWPLLEGGRVGVIVDRVFPLERVREAHEYLESGAHFGKVILQVR